MYGYGYPYGFYVDPTYVLLIIGMVLALAASGKMKSTFARYQQVRSHSGLTFKHYYGTHHITFI